MPPDTAGKPALWRSRSETGEASWETAVGPPFYATHWGLLKQPDNQTLSRRRCSRAVALYRLTVNFKRSHVRPSTGAVSTARQQIREADLIHFSEIRMLHP